MFKLHESNSNVRTEVLAGLTTFASMMYILVVNPAILSASGMPKDAVFTATVLASALMTLSMGLFTNLPIALAPGMGLNAFFTYTMCISHNIPWQAALGIVFYSGVLFLLVTMTGLRKKILALIPESLKVALATGIGSFITLIGLKNAGIITDHPATLITLGSLKSPEIWVILTGLILAVILHLKKVSANLLLSMIFITVGFAIMGKVPMPENLISLPPDISPVFMDLDLTYFWKHLDICLPLVISLFFVDLFDNMGTLIAVCTRAHLTDEKGEIKNLGKALKADAFAAMCGAVLGTSSVTSYVESAAGVEQGGRTGLAGVVTSACFLLSLFIAPLILTIPLSATTPALILVGFFMMSEVKRINFEDVTTAFPAFLTILMIPFTFSIAEGLAFGIVSYLILKFIRK